MKWSPFFPSGSRFSAVNGALKKKSGVVSIGNYFLECKQHQTKGDVKKEVGEIVSVKKKMAKWSIVCVFLVCVVLVREKGRERVEEKE